MMMFETWRAKEGHAILDRSDGWDFIGEPTYADEV